MNAFNGISKERTGAAPASRKWSFLLLGCTLIISFILILTRPSPSEPQANQSPVQEAVVPDERWTGSGHPAVALSRFPAANEVQTPEEVVADKLRHFARSRHRIAQKLADLANVPLPPDVEEFFAIAGTGRFEELKNHFENLRNKRQSEDSPTGLSKSWHAIFETFGVAEAVHDWPAARLLEFGNSVLGSLRPDMVYLGGSDAGRFIPTLLNSTPEGERHVVITQNALADKSYVEYIAQVHGDRISALQPEDSQKAFDDYLQDARKRAEHDLNFPHEPKQVKAGEQIDIRDGRTTVSGSVAVMSINERLVQALVARNPDTLFAMEDSFGLRSLLASSAPLGSLLELNARADEPAMNSERAATTLEHWRDASKKLLADPGDIAGLDAYSTMMAAHASMFQQQGLGAEADQAFRLALQLSPSEPHVLTRYSEFLEMQNRLSEAIPAVQAGINSNPKNLELQELLQQLKRKSGLLPPDTSVHP